MIKIFTYITAAVVLFGLGFGMAFDVKADTLANVHGGSLVPQFNFAPLIQQFGYQRRQQQQLQNQRQQNIIMQQQLDVQKQMLQQQRMDLLNRQLEAVKIK